MNIGIMFGGNSLEQEISIVTAYSIKKKLMDYYDITMIYINNNNEVFDVSRVEFNDFKINNYKKFKPTIFVNHGIKDVNIDCMILACHGQNSEDGVFSGICRFYNISYVGSDILASSIAMNKYLSYRYLSNNGIKMLDTYLYTYDDFINGVKNIIYPCILKPNCGGSSIGIKIANNDNEFEEGIADIFELSREVVIQKYYNNIVEYNLSLYESGYSRLEKIVNKDEIFSFENKYNESFKLMHQALEDDILLDEFKNIGRNVYNILGCSGIIRIDFFLIDNIIYVNEVNIIPGGLSMYLYDDFFSVINECIKKSILKPNITFERGNYLIKSDINK